MTARTLLKQPTAFLPLTMSTIAIATLLIHLARFGVTREADEWAAHIWQLMMAVVIPSEARKRQVDARDPWRSSLGPDLSVSEQSSLAHRYVGILFVMPLL
jgi:hypothetical protein